MAISPLSELDAAIMSLRGRVAGAVAQQGDHAYDSLRAGTSRDTGSFPVAVVVPRTAADVAEAVRFARRLGLRVAVSSTGHGRGRPADGALLVVTARLDGVSVDASARTASVGAGATWRVVVEAAHAHGLAPVATADTGIGAIGSTLGGGLGWLARRHGLACESVRSFDLVTPDGIEIHTSESEQPSLFGALKGGGAGSLGVVTAMEIGLYRLGELYAGTLAYPVDQAGEVLRRWRDWAPTIDHRLTSAVSIVPLPAHPGVPVSRRGRSCVVVQLCWCGDPDQGAALADSWRTWRRPVLDLCASVPYAALGAVLPDLVAPGAAITTTEWFDTLSDEAIEVVVRAAGFPAGEPVLSLSEIRHVGGAPRGAWPSAGDPAGKFLLRLRGGVPSPRAEVAVEAHLRETRRALAPFVTGATYLNFVEGLERRERSASAFAPERLHALGRVKGVLDPADRFCHGFALPRS